MRKRNMLLGLVSVLILFMLAWARPVLTQEDNTVSVLSGIVRLTLSESEILQYDDDETTLYYISKSSPDEKLENTEESGRLMLFQNKTYFTHPIKSSLISLA